MTFVRTEFVARVDAEIAANENKGPWAEFRPDVQECASQIQHHFRKLYRAMRDGNRAKVSEFAADVAGLCMKADELYGRPDQSEGQP